jgi:hypothetical protein
MNTQLNQLRSLLQESPSRQGWLEILTLLESSWYNNPSETSELLLPYLIEHGEDWDRKWKMAPPDWVQKWIEDVLPVSFLAVVSAISVSSCLSKWDSKPEDADFLRWVQELPADCPTLEGLYWGSLSEEMGEKWPNQYEAIIIKVLQSPAFRELKVLDLSLWEIRSDPHSPSQDDIYGFLEPQEVAEAIQTDSLEVLMLYGQRNPMPRSITAKHWKKLKNLEVLDLGGGFPIGQKYIAKLAKKLVSLKSLNIAASYDIAEYINEDFPQLEDDTKMEIAEYWWVHGNEYENFLCSDKQLEKLRGKYENISFVTERNREEEVNAPFLWSTYFVL